MPRNKKPVVDITNRPSGRDQHTTMEWSDHINLREAEDTLRDIQTVRTKLGSLTVRFVTEAICGEDQELARRILGQIDGEELVGNMTVDPRSLRRLADTVGGKKAHAVVSRSTLREVEAETAKPASDMSEQQVELLRALLKTMDPAVVKRALTGG